MAGLIGIPCSDTARYTAFADSLSNLDTPPDTQIRFAVSTWRHKARNEIVRWMLEYSANEWLLFLDDDQVFAPDLLNRLLMHEKDIVGALCMRRDEPYGPFCFSEIKDGPLFQPIDLRAHKPNECVRVASVGTGAMLIRRHVFEQMDEPWFRITDKHGEDMLFCQDAGKQFEIYCDLGTAIGHLTTAVVWPAYTKEWKVGFVISDETRILRDLPDDLRPYEA